MGGARNGRRCSNCLISVCVRNLDALLVR